MVESWVELKVVGLAYMMAQRRIDRLEKKLVALRVVGMDVLLVKL